jgi:hypothetical protein
VRIELSALLALLLAACACREPEDMSVAPGRLARTHPEAARSLLALVPDQARADEVFQAQPDGRAALALLGTGFSSGDVVHWGGRPLDTTFGNSRVLTAVVPAELLREPGDVEVTVENPSDRKIARLSATFRLRSAVVEKGG